MYVTLINQLASAVSQRVIDTLFPAKVIAVTGGYVTLNRGPGTAIGSGEVWEVFSAGQEMRDPDTGESLGHEEMKVGEIVIIDVLPKFSKGEIFGDNRGMATGNIARAEGRDPGTCRGYRRGKPSGQQVWAYGRNESRSDLRSITRVAMLLGGLLLGGCKTYEANFARAYQYGQYETRRGTAASRKPAARSRAMATAIA